MASSPSRRKNLSRLPGEPRRRDVNTIQSVRYSVIPNTEPLNKRLDIQLSISPGSVGLVETISSYEDTHWTSERGFDIPAAVGSGSHFFNCPAGAPPKLRSNK